MPFFKMNNASASKKNKTASAATTPSQTPRTSLDGKAPHTTTTTSTRTTQTSQAGTGKAYLANMQAMVLSRV